MGLIWALGDALIAAKTLKTCDNAKRLSKPEKIAKEDWWSKMNLEPPTTPRNRICNPLISLT